MRPLALRTSLTLVYTGILALLVSGLAFAYHGMLVRQLDADSTTVLGDITRGLHGYLQFNGGLPALSYSSTDPDAVTFIEDATRYYQVYNATTGQLLAQSPALEALGLHYTPAEVAAFRQDPGVDDLQTDRGRLRIQSSLIEPRPGELYLLQVGAPLDRLDRTIAGFEQRLIWQIVGSLIAAAVAGYWMAGRALVPLSRLARATRAIGISNLQQRVPVRGARDELDEVARTMNQALERVERSVADMRQFSAALAHELRTPLAILRGEAELALTHPSSPDDCRRTLAAQLDQFDKLARLINDLLTLARAEAGEITLMNDAVDLAALSASVAEQMELVAGARGVVLTCDASGPTVVTGDAGWLERLLLILLDNATKFTPSGRQIAVRVSPDGRWSRLDVIDTGSGIPPDAIPHVFERFFRSDAARAQQMEGVGLGLALAKWIVERHHGTIAVTSRVGEGSTFTVRLPRRPEDVPAAT